MSADDPDEAFLVVHGDVADRLRCIPGVLLSQCGQSHTYVVARWVPLVYRRLPAKGGVDVEAIRLCAGDPAFLAACLAVFDLCDGDPSGATPPLKRLVLAELARRRALDPAEEVE